MKSEEWTFYSWNNFIQWENALKECPQIETLKPIAQYLNSILGNPTTTQQDDTILKQVVERKLHKIDKNSLKAHGESNMDHFIINHLRGILVEDGKYWRRQILSNSKASFVIC